MPVHRCNPRPAPQATVASDKTYIMGRIKEGIGVEAFNRVLRKALHDALLGDMVQRALGKADTQSLVQLLRVGARAGPGRAGDGAAAACLCAGRQGGAGGGGRERGRT